MKSFRSTLDTSLSQEFLLHSSCYVLEGVSLTLLVLGLVKSFRSSPDTSFTEEFLLQYSGYVLVRSFSDTVRVGVSEEFLLHSSSWFK